MNLLVDAGGQCRIIGIARANDNAAMIWVQPMQANEIGCHIITASNDILNKLQLLGKDHSEYSLETVEMFHNDATAAGYTIPYQRRAVAS